MATTVAPRDLVQYLLRADEIPGLEATIAIEVEGPRVEPLSAAAKSVYERTGGTCPG